MVDNEDNGESKKRRAKLQPKKSLTATLSTVQREKEQKDEQLKKKVEPKHKLKPPKPEKPKLEPRAEQFQTALLKLGLKVNDGLMRVIMSVVPPNMNVDQFSKAIGNHFKRFGSLAKLNTKLMDIQKFVNTAIQNHIAMESGKSSPINAAPPSTSNSEIYKRSQKLKIRNSSEAGEEITKAASKKGPTPLPTKPRPNSNPDDI